MNGGGANSLITFGPVKQRIFLALGSDLLLE